MPILRGISAKFLRFAVVGVINTLVDWLAFFLLVGFIPFLTNLEPLAKAISFLLAVINSFVLNSSWTFKEEVESGKRWGIGFWDARRGFKFLATSLVGLGINTLLFTLVRNSSSFLPISQSRIIALVSATVASLIWNFAINLRWTYRISSEGSSSGGRSERLTLVLIGAVLLMGLFSAASDSVTTDEVPHLGAGYSYLASRRMLLNLEHPPLAKVLAAAPLVFLDLEEPSLLQVAEEDSEAERPYWVTQWSYGSKLLFEQRISHETILLLARIPMLLVLGLSAWFVYLLGKRLFGPRAGWISLVMFSLSPSFLAHGRLVTTDVGATLGFIATLYFFHLYLEKPGRKHLVLAAAALGIANLFKFSSLALYPILLALAAFKVFAEERKAIWAGVRRVLVLWIPLVVLGLGVTLGGYYLSFPRDVFPSDQGLDLLTTQNYHDQLGILSPITEYPVLRPVANYLAGAISVRNRLEGFSGTYVFGELSESSWWYFFPLSWSFKEPLPVVLGTLLALGVLLKLFGDRRAPSKLRFNLIFLFIPLVLFGSTAVLSKFTLGIRHILPVLPVVYLLVGGVVSSFWSRSGRWIRGGVLVAGVWLVVSTLWAFPNFLAYFNELQLLSGRQKFELFIDSNLEWGQNLIRLSSFVKERGIKEIKVDAWFFEEPVKHYIPEAIPWEEDFSAGEEGWLAVGVTGFQISQFGKEDRYAYLRDRQPYAVVGDGILVYKLE